MAPGSVTIAVPCCMCERVRCARYRTRPARICRGSMVGSSARCRAAVPSVRCSCCLRTLRA
eukprot:8054085-Prorocentrum_lima.AAC.1